MSINEDVVIDIDDCNSKPNLLDPVDQLARSIDPNDSMTGLPTEIRKQHINFFLRLEPMKSFPTWLITHASAY